MRYFLATFSTIYLAVVPSFVEADLMVDFEYLVDITFVDLPTALDVESDVSFITDNGGVASYAFVGGTENTPFSGDSFRIEGSTGNGEDSVSAFNANFTIDNPTAGTIALTMSIQGSASFAVTGSSIFGEQYSANSTLIWTNYDSVENFALYNKTVNQDFVEEIDWPTFTTWTMTLGPGSTGDFSITNISTTSGAGSSVPEPVSAFLAIPISFGLIFRRHPSGRRV